MTYARAVQYVQPFMVRIGDDACVHIANARPLVGPSAFRRMMAADGTRCPRPGFVEPADVVTWMVIAGAETCDGR